MPKRLFVLFFRFFLYLFFRKHLAHILYKIENKPLKVNSNLPVLLLANHVSWWDGFLIIFLCEKIIPQRQLLIAMLKSEWSKRKWMSSIGAVPIDPSSPSQLLSFFKMLKKKKEITSSFCLAYFYEGSMANPGEQPSTPKRGTEVVVDQLAPMTVLPVSITMDFRYRSKTSAFVKVGTPREVNNSTELSQSFTEINRLLKSTHLETTSVQEHMGELLKSDWRPLW